MLVYQQNSEMNNWIISEDCFSKSHLGRVETLFNLGNGYMGVRGAFEEPYIGQHRGMFVAGTFNKFSPKDVTELPNVPDVTRLDIIIDGTPLSLECGNFTDFLLTLDMKSGIFRRSFTFRAEKGCIDFLFERFVSQYDKHLFAQRVIITPHYDVSILVRGGIDGTTTNTGVQHFYTEDKRIHGNNIIQMNSTTSQSGVQFFQFSGFTMSNNSTLMDSGRLSIGSRHISMEYAESIKAGETICFDRCNSVYTSRDKEFQSCSSSEIQSVAVENLSRAMQCGFDQLKEQHLSQWKHLWDRHDVVIESNNFFDQISVRYAIMQILMMTPSHDNRMNIGAKGLTGEAYKGHTFWDTELFLLPFWISSNPSTAKSLLEYRYLSLAGAQKKAKENGYEGAMYPWESAWINDGEVTPRWGAADVVTGEPIPIICGDLEQHITSDVAYGVWSYFNATQDVSFMESCGYEIIFETAKFWQSRWEWCESHQRYYINNVIGPDEYSEHVDNNAFTNYMSWWNVKLAITYYNGIKRGNKDLYNRLNRKLGLDLVYGKWLDKVDKLYLPQINSEGLLPQDDTYLGLPTIDITNYKQSQTRADIIKDYNMEQIAQLQVSKQADVVVLMNILDSFFTRQEMLDNFQYYESRCLHDSSLSLSMYSLSAFRVGEVSCALHMMRRAQEIDLNNNPMAAADGIHAASMGGIWQTLIFGVAGLRLDKQELEIDPVPQNDIQRVLFKVSFRNRELRFDISKKEICIVLENGEPLSVVVRGQSYMLKKVLTIRI